jgi:hypothetical protein
MLTFPLLQTPNLTFTTTVAKQPCRINLYTGTDNLTYFDLFLNNVPIVQYVICENLKLLVQMAYLGFVGDFMFMDSQGSNDPVYTGFGSRYNLVYLNPTEAAQYALL